MSYRSEGGSTQIKVKDLFTMYLSSDGFEIINVSYDIERTKVQLYSQNNSIGVHLINSTFNATADYGYDMDPPISSDNGTVHFGFSELNLNAVFQIGNEDDPNNVDVKFMWAELGLRNNDTELLLNNTNQFNELTVFVLNTIKPALIGVLTRVFDEHLEEGINAAIHAIPAPLMITDELAFNISLLQAGQIFEKYTLNQLYGRFFPINTPELPFTNNVTIPTWITTGGTLQLYISEYTIQSYFYSQYVLGNVYLMIEESPNESLLKFNVGSFKYFIPALTQRYSDNQKTRFWLKAEHDYPRIAITSRNIVLTGIFHVGIDVNVGDDNWETAVIFEAETQFDGNLEITGELVLKPTVNHITFGVNEIVETKLNNVNIEMIRRILLPIETLVRFSVNIIFFRGIKLTDFLPISLNFDLGQYDFSLHQGYMQLWASPDLSSETNMEVIEHLIDTVVFRTKPILRSDNTEVKLQSFGSIFKKHMLAEMSRTNFKDLFGRHPVSGIRSTYKGYKFFEGVLNMGNPDYSPDQITDL